MPNPFDSKLLSSLDIDGKAYQYYSLLAMKDPRIGNDLVLTEDQLPYSIRVLLESAIRCCDNFKVRESDVETILDWAAAQHKDQEIQFTPSRVLLQDFTGVPVVVDLAAMRDAVSRLGGDPNRVNPLVPVDLVIDHSVQVDHFRDADSLQKNLELEFQRNEERFKFLKWYYPF